MFNKASIRVYLWKNGCGYHLRVFEKDSVINCFGLTATLYYIRVPEPKSLEKIIGQMYISQNNVYDRYIYLFFVFCQNYPG